MFNESPGWGKTAVIAETARYFLEKEPNKTVCILAPTVPLVQQHAHNLEHVFFIPKVLAKHGTPDDWKNRVSDRVACVQWKHDLESCNAIVFSPQIFLEALLPGFLQLNRISVVAFDECHHAVGRNPMALILKHLEQRAKQIRIFGLTATFKHGAISKDPGKAKIELEQSKQEMERKFRVSLKECIRSFYDLRRLSFGFPNQVSKSLLAI